MNTITQLEKTVYVVKIQGPNSHIVPRLAAFTVSTNRTFSTYSAAVRYLRAYLTKNHTKWAKAIDKDDLPFLKR